VYRGTIGQSHIARGWVPVKIVKIFIGILSVALSFVFLFDVEAMARERSAVTFLALALSVTSLWGASVTGILVKSKDGGIVAAIMFISAAIFGGWASVYPLFTYLMLALALGYLIWSLRVPGEPKQEGERENS